MRNVIKAVLLIQTLVLSAEASTVGWGAAIDTGIGLNSPTTNTTALAVGSWIRLGFFANGGVPLTASEIKTLADAGNKSSLGSFFQEFGSAKIGDGVSGEAGVLSKSSNNATAAFGSKTAYMWAYNAGGVDPAAGLAAATQWGIFTAAAWIFPADTDTGSLTIDINQVPVSSAGIIVGQSTLGTATVFGSSTSVYRLAEIVPEPSSLLLSAIGLAGIATRRRRVRK